MWKTADHCVHQAHGYTRDCSISGAFIVTNSKVPIGSTLQMDFSLPRLHATGHGARLRTRGYVIRTESEGFAVIANLAPEALLHIEARSADPDLQVGRGETSSRL